MAESQTNYAIDPTPPPSSAEEIQQAGRLGMGAMLKLIRDVQEEIKDVKAELHGLTKRHEKHFHAVEPRSYGTGTPLEPDMDVEAERR